MKKGSFWKNYGFLILMLTGIVAGCVVGAIWPAVKDADGEIIVKGATVLEPLGTVFLNLMFCIAVPTVFCSISWVIADIPRWTGWFSLWAWATSRCLLPVPGAPPQPARLAQRAAAVSTQGIALLIFILYSFFFRNSARRVPEPAALKNGIATQFSVP